MSGNPKRRKERHRQKISTTVAPETYRYLQERIKQGKASTLAEAIDDAIAILRRQKGRVRLALATARYFGQLDTEALAEEQEIASDLSSAAGVADFEH